MIRRALFPTAGGTIRNNHRAAVVVHSGRTWILVSGWCEFLRVSFSRVGATCWPVIVHAAGGRWFRSPALRPSTPSGSRSGILPTAGDSSPYTGHRRNCACWLRLRIGRNKCPQSALLCRHRWCVRTPIRSSDAVTKCTRPGVPLRKQWRSADRPMPLSRGFLCSRIATCSLTSS